MKNPRLAIRIFNAVYIAMCTFCACWFAFTPFLNFSVTYPLDAATMKKLMGSEAEKYDIESAFQKYEFEGYPKGTYPVNMDVKATPSEMVAITFSPNPEESLKTSFVDPEVNDIVDQIDPVLNEIIESVGKQIIAENATEQIGNFVTGVMGGDSDAAKEACEKAGINEQYINQATDELWDSLTAPNADLSTITETMSTIIDNSAQKLVTAGYPEFADQGMTEEKKAEFQIELYKVLQPAGLVTDDGKITSPEAAMSVLIDRMLGGNGGTTPLPPIEDTETTNQPEKGEIPPEENSASGLARYYASTGDGEGQSQDERKQQDIAALKTKVSALIYSKINPYLGSFTTGFRITTFVLMGIIALWAFYAVMILVKSFTKKSGFNFLAIFFILSIVSIILGAGLYTFGILFNKGIFNQFIANLPFISSISFTLLTSFLIPSFITIAIFIMSFFYRPLKKKLKKQLKSEKFDRAALAIPDED